MLAISIRNPMPWCIFEDRSKDPMRVINVEAETKHRGSLLIHAGPLDLELEEWLRKKFGLPIPQPNRWNKGQPLKTGGIVGIVEVVDCARRVKSRWSNPDKWNLVIKRPFPYQFEAHPGGAGLFEYKPV